jgi:NitT/TauT family transport system substrate-binding protein
MKQMLALFLLAALLPANAFAQSSTRIRIATLGAADASAVPIFAQAAGIFKKYALEADVTSYNGGGAIIAAIAGGSLDAGYSNITSAIAALQNGIPVIVLLPAELAVAEHENVMLVKARRSTLRTGADLNGKVVAVSTLGGTLQLAAETWIDKNGGDSRSVHFLELPTSSMANALKQGRIDAAMLGQERLEPNKADIEVLGNAFAAISPLWSSGVFVVSKAWVSANPDAARRFVTAMNEASRWANAHHAETARILAPVAGIDPAVLQTMTRATFGVQLTRAMLQPGIDAAVKYGALKQPFDSSEIVTAAAPYWR